MFALCRAGRYVHAEGARRRLPFTLAESLESEIGAFFRRGITMDGPPVLVGALPFDARASAFLYQPRRFERGAGPGPFAAPPGGGVHSWAPYRIVADPDPAIYAAMVRQALARIGKGALEKVVLARKLRIEASAPVDALQVARRLTRDANVATFLLDLPGAAGQTTGATLVGASPELLVRRTGKRVLSHPLAGSAPRSHDRATDEAHARALLQSDKDQREHALVVEAILDMLAPHCTSLGVPDGATLYSTATMWHLGTRIEGELKKDAPSAAGLAALLHPTPAVGGAPRAAALDTIRALEPGDRGFYAGAIGWTDTAGDGAWFVTLRCAEICGTRMTLQAGAGIVAGSDPDGEVAETAAKFRAMLRAIEMDEAREVLETIS